MEEKLYNIGLTVGLIIGMAILIVPYLITYIPKKDKGSDHIK